MWGYLPYTDIHDPQEGFAMIENICENFEGFTKQEFEEAIFVCKTQEMLAHLTNKSFK